MLVGIFMYITRYITYLLGRLSSTIPFFLYPIINNWQEDEDTNPLLVNPQTCQPFAKAKFIVKLPLKIVHSSHNDTLTVQAPLIQSGLGMIYNYMQILGKPGCLVFKGPLKDNGHIRGNSFDQSASQKDKIGSICP